MMYRLLLVCVLGVALAAAPCAADGLAAYEPAALVLMQPVIDGTGEVATEQDDAGQTRLLFEETLAGEGTELEQAVRRALETRPAFDTVRRLFTVARQEIREAGRSPRPEEPTLLLVVGNVFGEMGPSHAGHPVRVRRADGSITDADDILIVSDIPGRTPIDVFTLVKERYLSMTLAHELAHQVLAEAYGPDLVLTSLSRHRGPRDVGMISDPALAFSEGWAEAVEALLGEILLRRGATDHGELSDNPVVRRFLRTRQDLLRHNKYILDSVSELEGNTRNGLQMLSTEGVVGFQLYQLMLHRQFSFRSPLMGFKKLVRFLAEERPRHLGEHFQALARREPELADTWARMLHEWTAYVLHSPEGARLYRAKWGAIRRYQRYLLQDETKDELAQEAREAEEAYNTWKEERFQTISASGHIFEALPDPLWMDRGLMRTGLNLATAEDLGRFLDRAAGRDRQNHVLARKITDFRDDRGHLETVGELEDIVDSRQLGALRKAREAFLRTEASLQPPSERAAAYVIEPDSSLTGRLSRWVLEGEVDVDTSRGATAPSPH